MLAFPRLLRIILALSLTLNLVILGLVAGAVLRHPDRPDRDRSFAFGPFDQALNDDDRAALRGAFRKAAPDFGGTWRQMREDMHSMIAILRTEPYDQDAVDALLDAQGARGQQMMDLGQQLLAERLSSMSPQDRQEFADRLERQLERRAPPPHP
ncbi:periplasmic heavy metal sensor [Falsirhodobacter algicola]|uniref:Periplasmic heavy metal sensor n=1 Tax=Falsirhodobacter algicola TaxID=2692330 RepID=A0A8J8SJU2_9RHOB|nr:periplasmic heavy metal sensor [Falsirhodobacter algicola]QUS34796.1 periplasmic heavy metal sensor [Falsirhodobacter algicola]